MRWRDWTGGIGLTLSVVAILTITMKPGQFDRSQRRWIDQLLDAMHGLGVSAWFGYDQLEFTANIVMFLPVGFFLGVLLRRRRWIGVILVTLLTVTIETVQLIFLPARVASLGDVIANSLGGWIGLGAAVLLLALLGTQAAEQIQETGPHPLHVRL